MPTLTNSPRPNLRPAVRALRTETDGILLEYRLDLAGIHARQVLALPLPLFAQMDEGYAAGYCQALEDAAAEIAGKETP